MLVCSVSLRAPRRAVSVNLAEIAAANDASTTGNIVFATLVDDPASVRDTVNAYLGEIMVEAASAADVVNAGLAYAAAIDEAVTAVDTPAAALGAAMLARMVAGPMINSDTSREAYVDSVMINQ